MQDIDLYALPVALALAFVFLVPMMPVLVIGIIAFCRPPALHIHRLRQGGRDIAFVEMSHVAPAAYFDRVRTAISREGAKGACYVYEKIGPGSDEDSDRLARLMGTKPGVSHMQEFKEAAKLTGWVVQPHDTFLGLTGKPDVWADVNLSDLMAALPTEAGRPKTPRITPKLLKHIGKVSRATARFDPLKLWLELGTHLLRGHVVRQQIRILASKGMDGGVSSGQPKGDLERLMEMRDRRLTEVVLATPGPLVITYGAAHFPVFLRMMREVCPVEILRSEPLRLG